MEDQQERLFWTDLARTAAIFSVVIVHVAADVITEWGRFSAGWWWAANLYDSFARGCVPFFVMLSGALLLPKEESYSDFFSRRFRRIFIPCVVWTLFYLGWKKIFYQPNLGFFEALKLVVNGGVYFHLWFLYIIIGLYLLTPVLREFVARVSRKTLLYFLLLWFLVSCVAPFWTGLDGKFFHTGLRFSLPMEMAQGFIGYFILGYVLRQTPVENKRGTALVVWSLSWLICFFGTYFLSRKCGGYQGLLYDNMAPNVVLYTASGFLLFKNAEGWLLSWPRALREWIVRLSGASFGIYLAHMAFLDILIKGRLGLTLKGDLFHPAWMIPLTALVVYGASFFTVRAIEKIPVLKRIV